MAAARMRKVALGLALSLVVALTAGWWLLDGQIQVDRSSADYRARMQSIWPGPAPGEPDADSVPLDIDSVLFRPLFRSELEQQTPYLLRFAASGPGPSPALLILPGGGYSFRSEKLDGTDLARFFSQHGISAYVLNYRVDPYRYPVPLLDARRALRWLRAHASDERLDASRVGALGSSAGGHLAALLATEPGVGNAASPDPVERQSSRPDVLVLSQAVVSLLEHVHEGSRRRLLGGSPPPGLARELSAELRVTSATPPAFVWTTRTDEMVDYRNSELFAAALRAHGVEHELLLFPEGPHGRGLARAEKYARQWPERCLAWLRRVGFLSPG